MGKRKTDTENLKTFQNSLMEDRYSSDCEKYLTTFPHISSPTCSLFGVYPLMELNTYSEYPEKPRGLGWILYAFLFKRLEKGIVFQAKKLEKHIPGVPKSWKTVLKISGNPDHCCALCLPHDR